jgi:heat shock protein HtpX
MGDHGVRLAESWRLAEWAASARGHPPQAAFHPHRTRASRSPRHNNPDAHIHWRRSHHRAGNQHGSEQVIAGLVLLLAVCGWVHGGESGARRALAVGTPAFDGPISPEVMLHRFGARRLQIYEMPALFKMLRQICARARLTTMPDLYYIADPGSMNAYALGKPAHSVITITEGLLRGLTPSELAAILAHEVAHICNHDTSAMSWAAALQQAIASTSAGALLSMQHQACAFAPGQALTVLLTGASSIAQLLSLCLSRLRELDADALALELLDDPQALVTALGKLERHHAGHEMAMMRACEDQLEKYLRSHPATAERVAALVRLSR